MKNPDGSCCPDEIYSIIDQRCCGKPVLDSGTCYTTLPVALYVTHEETVDHGHDHLLNPHADIVSGVTTYEPIPVSTKTPVVEESLNSWATPLKEWWSLLKAMVPVFVA
jgi:hypothetical protein